MSDNKRSRRLLLIVPLALPLVLACACLLAGIGYLRTGMRTVQVSQSVQALGIELVVEQVDVRRVDSTVHVAVTNHNGASVSLPVFANFVVVDAEGRQYEPYPISDFESLHVAPDATATAAIRVSSLRDAASPVRVRFNVVYGVIGGLAGIEVGRIELEN